MSEPVMALLRRLATAVLLKRSQYLYTCSLEALCGRPPRAPAAGLSCEIIDRENVERVRDWLGTSEVWHFRRLLNRGDVGIYVLVGGEVIHYSWAALKLSGHALAHAHDPIEMGDALLHRGFTREGQRQQGIGTYAVTQLFEHLRERCGPLGLRRVCALVKASNLPPQRVFAGLGFRLEQQMTMVRLLGTCFIYRVWDLPPDETAAAGRAGRLLVRFKVPEILWEPRLPLLRSGFE